MSRSHRKTPKGGITTARSNKRFKVYEHSRERMFVRMALRVGKEDLLHPKETGNEWASPRDGKVWFGYNYPKEMRK